jgi:outer membrane protein, heavy metal efflux system
MKKSRNRAIRLQEEYLRARFGQTSSFTSLRAFTFCSFLLSLSLSFSSSAFATDCKKVVAYKQALECSQENHPDILRAHAAKIRAERLVDQAGQRPNLELSGKALRNTADGDQNSGEAGLVHTFELGGKRSARIEKAQVEGEIGKLDFEAAKSEVLLQTLIDLQKLKNLKNEAALVDEGVSIYSRIIKTFKSRLKLTPEQDVSLNVYSLALEDAKIKASLLGGEIGALIKFIELRTGSKIEFSEELLPPKRSTWTDMSAVVNAEARSTKVRLTEFSLKLANSEKELAKSGAWPDLKLGPDFEWSQSSAGREQSLGLTLTLPLPIWNRNQGGISVAEAEAERARLSLDLTKKELEVEKASWLVKYEQGVRAIKDGIGSEEMRKRHLRFREQFTRGLVPSALVIEANRQILEFTKSKNEQELSTLEALWNLKRLEGKLNEVLE